MAQKLWHEELDDLRDDRYAAGFGTGYKTGADHMRSERASSEVILSRIENLDSLLRRPAELSTTLALNSVLEMTEENGKYKMLIDGKEVDDITLKELKGEAELLSKFRIWCIMKETVRKHAIDLGMKKSTEWEHVIEGKMMIHNLGILDSIITAVQKYKPKTATPPASVEHS